MYNARAVSNDSDPGTFKPPLIKPEKRSRIRDRLFDYWKQVRAKGINHWLLVGILTALGLAIGQALGTASLWTDVRNSVYQFQTSHLGPSTPSVTRTVFVLIDDNEYWTGEPAHRQPIKRDYLARLLLAVAGAHPDVVALDFDLRSPVPSGDMVEHPDYIGERATLLKALKDVAQNTPVVIPKSIQLVSGKPVEQSDIFRGFDFPAEDKIFPGYIQLAYDLRVIPPRLRIREGGDGMIDSFALAVLHASDPRTYNKVVQKQRAGDEVNLRFGTFPNQTDFEDMSFSSVDVMIGKKEVIGQLEHRIVVVGGKWHRDALGSGQWNDEHATPAGKIIGAYVQGHYAEALLKGKWCPVWPEGWATAIETLIVLVTSVFLALDVAARWKVTAAIVPSLMIMVLSYFLLQNLGAFFEFFVPLLIISGHGIVEHLQWRPTGV